MLNFAEMEDRMYGQRGAIILGTVVILFLADLVLKAKKAKGRYEILHAIGNGVATFLTFDGMLSTLLEPMKSWDGPWHALI